MKAIITSAKEETVQQDGSKFLAVEFEIRDGETLIDTKRIGFATDATSDEVLADVEKYVANFEAEQRSREANADRYEEEEQINATIVEIVGVEVEPKAEETTPEPVE